MANLTVLQDGSERIHYSNPFIPIYACRGNLRGLSGMAALCHWHEEVEFLLPFKGHLYYNINGARLLIPQGDAVFVNSRNLHYGFSDGGRIVNTSASPSGRSFCAAVRGSGSSMCCRS